MTGTGFTALMAAATGGHLEVARLLLDRLADPNQAKPDNRFTPLMYAADRGHLEVARLLLDRLADPNQANTDDGHAPLMGAATATWRSPGCCLIARPTRTRHKLTVDTPR